MFQTTRPSDSVLGELANQPVECFNTAGGSQIGHYKSTHARRSEARKEREECAQAFGCAESNYEILWRYNSRHQACLRQEAPQDIGRWASQNCKGAKGAVGESTSREGQEGSLKLLARDKLITRFKALCQNHLPSRNETNRCSAKIGAGSISIGRPPFLCGRGEICSCLHQRGESPSVR